MWNTASSASYLTSASITVELSKNLFTELYVASILAMSFNFMWTDLKVAKDWTIVFDIAIRNRTPLPMKDLTSKSWEFGKSNVIDMTA